MSLLESTLSRLIRAICLHSDEAGKTHLLLYVALACVEINLLPCWESKSKLETGYIKFLYPRGN